MMRRLIFSLVLKIILIPNAFSQQLKPGFDKHEFEEVLKMSLKHFYPKETGDMPEPAHYTLKYQSDSVGLDNIWQLWIRKDNSVASLSIRGTSGNTESWLANFYAAMVPAKGQLKLDKDFVFDYHLADNPKAAVHVGWLISTAYLTQNMLPKIDSCYNAGIKNFIINGHSQGGAITYLLTAHLSNLQKTGRIPSDIRFKTYGSAAPKPGNQFFAYDYNLLTQEGWAYNVINPYDWVPETFLSVQTASDFNDVNVVQGLERQIKKMPLIKRTVAKGILNSVKKPSVKTQKKYQKYFGKYVSKMIHKHLPNFETPTYYPSSNYALTGNLYVLPVPASYIEEFNEKSHELMVHHQPMAYYTLIRNLISN